MSSGDDNVDPPYVPLLEESAEDLYEHAPCGYLSTLADGRIVKVNQTFLNWTGLRREDLVGRRRFDELLTGGGRIYHETHYAPLLQMQGWVREIALEIVCADGRRLPVLVNSVLKRDADGTPLLTRTTVFDATDRKAYERELLLARRREAEARRRAEVLQRVTAAVAAATDRGQVAAAVAAEVAAGLGSGCALLAVPDDEGAPAVVGRHGDPALLEHVEAQLTDGALARAVAAHPAGASGAEPVVVERSAVVTLLAGGQPSGLLCIDLAPGRELDPDERALLVACARQSEQALERAALYERERDVAHTLQRSLLARDLPPDTRYAVESRYRPGVAGLEVGGDWYDVFTVREGTIAVAVGDVVGRGLIAATTMGQLRSAVRALATGGTGPARLLERLDGFVAPIPSARMATLAYAELDLGDGTLRYACAGHPPPVLMQPGGGPALLWDGRTAPLGAYSDPVTRPEARVRLRPGARLVLYTDGLVEVRDAPLDDRLEQLVVELARRADAPLGALVDAVLATMLEGEAAADDVCLLALALAGDPGAGGAPGPASGGYLVKPASRR